MIGDLVFEICYRPVFDREKEQERGEDPAYAVNFPILYPSYCTRMCVRGSRRPARLPNSFHLVDLNLTASQTTQRDKAALNLHSPKGGLLYRQREMPLCMRTTGNATSLASRSQH